MTSALLTGTMNSLEAAEYLGVSVATLKRWRGQEAGPPYIQMGERLIRYRQTDLDRWILSNRKENGEA
jgi:excisionase family DNA binding protein